MKQRILAGVRVLAVFVYLRAVETKRRGKPWYTLEVVVNEQTNGMDGARDIETVVARSVGSHRIDAHLEEFENVCDDLQSKLVAKGAGQ